MIIDFLILNTNSILSCTMLLNIFNLTEKKLYYLLCLDLIINGVPFVTIILLLLYYLNMIIFKYLNNSFLNKYICLIIYYFVFNIVLYSIFNHISMFIINKLIDNLAFNLLFYYVGLKYLEDKYNIKGDKYE